MNFEKSNRGAKTLYFLKRNFNWMPFYIFQIDNSLSDTEGLSGSIINQNKPKLFNEMNFMVLVRERVGPKNS